MEQECLGHTSVCDALRQPQQPGDFLFLISCSSPSLRQVRSAGRCRLHFAFMPWEHYSCASEEGTVSRSELASTGMFEGTRGFAWALQFVWEWPCSCGSSMSFLNPGYVKNLNLFHLLFLILPETALCSLQSVAGRSPA